jgi:hypothetical protein
MMRVTRLVLILVGAIALAAAQAVNLHANAPASYASLLSGSIISPICTSENFASGDTSGAFSGAFYVAFDCVDGSIAGGTWLILVTTQDIDGTILVHGTIRGQVVGGLFEADATGERVTLQDVTLTITEGTGEFSSIAQGTGSLEATSDPEGEPQFVGTLGLTF